MYKYALIFIAIFSITYAQDDCSEIQNSLECVEVGCEWLVTYQQIGNELVLIELVKYFKDTMKIKTNTITLDEFIKLANNQK